MRTRIFLFVTIVTGMFLFGIGVHAQGYNPGFWNNYYAAQNGFNSGTMAAGVANQRRANEAILNEMRASRGLPPCSLAPINLSGRPSCP
jgi:hypothetical protein